MVHKTSDKGVLDLEVFLKTGHTVPTHVLREKHESCSILLYDVGISQAQVSRLEKNALKNMIRNI